MSNQGIAHIWIFGNPRVPLTARLSARTKSAFGAAVMMKAPGLLSPSVTAVMVTSPEVPD
jgi:hypothetical protein